MCVVCWFFGTKDNIQFIFQYVHISDYNHFITTPCDILIDCVNIVLYIVTKENNNFIRTLCSLVNRLSVCCVSLFKVIFHIFVNFPRV